MEALGQHVRVYAEIARTNDLDQLAQLPPEKLDDKILWITLALHNCVELIQFGLDNNYIEDREAIARHALVLGHIEMLRAVGMDFPSLYTTAATYGSVVWLEWLETNNVEMNTADAATCRAAAQTKSLDTIRWCVEKEFATSISTLYAASHLPIIKYLVEDVGIVPDAKMLSLQARHNRDDNLKYLYLVRRRHPIDKTLAFALVRNNNKGMLLWLRDNGLRWRPYYYMEAVRCGDSDMIRWLHKHECPINKDDLLPVTRDERIQALIQTI